MAQTKKKTTKQPAAKETVMISIRIPSGLQQQAKAKSERTGVPISFVVRKALEEWVKTKGMFALYDPKDETADDGDPFGPDAS